MTNKTHLSYALLCAFAVSFTMLICSLSLGLVRSHDHIAQAIIHTQPPEQGGKIAISAAPLNPAAWRYFTSSNHIPASQKDYIHTITEKLPALSQKNYSRLGLLGCIAAILLLYGCITIIQNNAAHHKKSDPTLSSALGYLPSQRKQNKLRRLNPAPNMLLFVWLLALATYQCTMLIWWTPQTTISSQSTPLLHDINALLSQHNITTKYLLRPNTLEITWQFIVNMMVFSAFGAFQFIGQRKRHIKTLTTAIACLIIIQLTLLVTSDASTLITSLPDNKTLPWLGLRYDLAQITTTTPHNIGSLLLVAHGILPCALYAAGWLMLALHHIFLIKKRKNRLPPISVICTMIAAPALLLLPSDLHQQQQYLFMTLIAYIGLMTGLMHQHKKRRFHFHT